MAKATRLPASSERAKDKRRLHLREIKDDPEAQLDSVGATLRAARLNRGVDTDQVAATLKMRKDHVEAIEDNDFARLPGRTYAIGFVRAYARFLGLDAEVMVKRFKEESAGREHDRPVELVFPDAPEEKRAANGSLLLVAMLIAAGVAGAIFVSMPQRHVTVEAPAKPDTAAVVVNETPQPVYDGAQTPDVPVEPAVLPPAAPSGSTPPAASTAIAAAPAPATPPAAAAPEGAPRVFGSENAGARIVFHATAQTYILVKEMGPTGKVTILDRTLNAGESYRAPNKPGILLITGNAGGLDVEIDGKKVGTLGKSGETLRNIPVDASQLVERLASPPAATAPAAAPAKPAGASATPKPAAAATTPKPPSASAEPTSQPKPAAPVPAPAATAPSQAPAPTTTPATPQ